MEPCPQRDSLAACHRCRSALELCEQGPGRQGRNRVESAAGLDAGLSTVTFQVGGEGDAAK